MNEFTFHIMMQDGKFDLCMQAEEKLDNSAINELLDVFSVVKGDKCVLNPVQEVSDELKLKVKNYVERYKKQSPQLNKFNKKIADLPKGEKFLVLSDAPTETKDILQLELLLTAINSFENENEIIDFLHNKHDEFNKSLSASINNYNLYIPKNNTRVVIGEKVKERRICRFCGGTLANGAKFKKVAHAIPEALGNKNIILAEECDSCNEFFGDNIEPSLIEYLNFHRVTLGVKGKDGYPKIKYKNGMAYFDGEKAVVMSKDIKQDESGNLTVKLISNNKFTSVNFYKTLCKMTLSVIDKEQIKCFHKTINWLRYNEELNLKLPRVGMFVNNSGFTPVPQIAVLTRKNGNIQSPHVVSEFRIGSYVFVYILPFSSKDDLNYTSEEEMKLFYETFPQFSVDTGWSYVPFDSSEPKELVSTINMNQN